MDPIFRVEAGGLGCRAWEKVFFFLEVTTPSSGFAGLPSQVGEEGAGRTGARDEEERALYCPTSHRGLRMEGDRYFHLSPSPDVPFPLSDYVIKKRTTTISFFLPWPATQGGRS